MLAQREFDDSECTLALGDLVAFWTDGVTERRGDQAMFGEDRLRELLRGLANRSASDVARTIDEAVVDFAPGLPEDDVAILVARLTATPVAREGEAASVPARGFARRNP